MLVLGKTTACTRQPVLRLTLSLNGSLCVQYTSRFATKDRQEMNRNELQEISRIRVREAKVLLDASQFSGAYYLLGYSVECAIKSCIAKKTVKYQFPDKDFASKSHSHEFVSLMQLAGIWGDLQRDIKLHQPLQDNWLVVKDWKVTSRYTASVSQAVAKDFHSACVARKHGVLSWIKNYW